MHNIEHLLRRQSRSTFKTSNPWMTGHYVNDPSILSDFQIRKITIYYNT